jgi:hypothetical protein
MIEVQQRNSGGSDRISVIAVQPSEGNRSPVLRSMVVIYLLGMLVLLPVQFVALPLNLALVDLWNLLALPIAWLYLIRVHQPVRLSYIAPMWLVLLGSLIGMFSSHNPLDSLIVLLKEIYLYIEFLTLAALFASLDAIYLRRIMFVWVSVVILHGVLIIVEFVSFDTWQSIIAYAGRFGALDVDRPPGLFDNANGGGLFQLMGFAPLLLMCSHDGPLGRRSLSSNRASIVAIFLVLSIGGTGSLGATAGFLVGLIITLIAITIVSGRLGSVVKVLVRLVVAAVLLGGLFYGIISESPDFQSRIAYYFYDRAEGSAEGRFTIWQYGVNTLLSEMPVWGLGPGNVRDELTGKTMHNDLLAFALERGVVGILGLVLFGAMAVYKAIRTLLIYKKHLDQAGLAVAVLLAAVIAALVESQFHQVFHERSLWLVLAVQEAMFFRMMTFERDLEPSTSSLNVSPRHLRTLVAQMMVREYD